MPKPRSLPTEIYVLRCSDGSLMQAKDDEGDPFLAFHSLEDAELSRDYHRDKYGFELEVIRLDVNRS